MENFEFWHVITTMMAALAGLYVFLARRIVANGGEITSLKERVKVIEVTAASNVEMVKAITAMKGEVKGLREDMKRYHTQVTAQGEAIKDLERQRK